MAHRDHAGIFVPPPFIFVPGFRCFSIMLGAIFFFPLALLTVDVNIIRREERYLSQKFGDPYREYLNRMRRWL